MVQNFFQQNKIGIQNMKRHEKYKYFAKHYPADFAIAFKQIAHRIDEADKFLVKIGVKILYPLPSPDLSNISKKIVDFASILLDSFPNLESNDAMHLSIADYLNITDIISLDDSYKDVDTFTIFALQ